MEFNGGGGIVGMTGGGFTPYVDYTGQHNANLNYVSSQQPSQAQLYGGGSFGAQPAAYAALGAAYGRATGGFRGSSTPAAPQPSYGVYGGNALGYRAPTPSPAPFQSAYAGGGVGSSFGGGAYGALAGGRYGGAAPSNPWPQANPFVSGASSLAYGGQSPYSAFAASRLGTSPGMAQGYGGLPSWFGSGGSGGGATFAQRFSPFGSTPYSLHGNEGISAINRAAGISPFSGQQYGMPRAAMPFNGGYTEGGFRGMPAPSMANFRSPSTSYGSFQARAPYTQWFGATGNDPTKANAIYALAGRTGYNPAAHAGVAQMESRFNPAQKTGSHYGIYQLSGSGSQNMWGDSPFRGTMGGLTFPQYKAASAPQQINAYGDWLTRGNVNTMNRGYNFPSASVPTQAAALQAMQFAGNSPGWRTAYGQGNMNVPVTPKPQASELGGGSVHGPTMNQMSNAYSNMFSRWGR